MDPEQGRFIARDTIGAWGDANNLGNPFAYVGNNPWSGLDPYGEGPIWDSTKQVLGMTGRKIVTGVTDLAVAPSDASLGLMVLTHNAFSSNEIFAEDVAFFGNISGYAAQSESGTLGDLGNVAVHMTGAPQISDMIVAGYEHHLGLIDIDQLESRLQEGASNLGSLAALYAGPKYIGRAHASVRSAGNRATMVAAVSEVMARRATESRVVENGARGRTSVETTGQVHHAVSRTVQKALERHPNLAGKYTPRDPRFVTRAIDEAAHRGYQKWHRDLDVEVVKWIRSDRSTTPAEFETYLKNRYNEADLKKRFPNGLN